MPVYDYKCENCGKLFEELVISYSVPDSEIKCPECGEYKAKQKISAPSIAGSSSSHSSSCGTNGFT